MVKSRKEQFDTTGASVGDTFEVNGGGNLIFAPNAGGGGGGSSTLAETLSLGNTTDGYNIDLNSGSAIFSSDGYVLINDNLDVTGDGSFSGDVSVAGKLTVTGIIDPTGLVLVEQATVPGGTPITGSSTLWIRSTDGYFILTDDLGVDNIIGSQGSIGSQSLASALGFGNTTGGTDIVLTENLDFTLGYLTNTTLGGGNLTIISESSNNFGGGDLYLRAGVGGGDLGGNAVLEGGAASGGDAGGVAVNGGNATGGGFNGGTASLSGGAGNLGGDGGNVSITSGNGGATGDSGNVSIQSSGSVNAGTIGITAGNSTGAAGAPLDLVAGDSDTLQGGDATLGSGDGYTTGGVINFIPGTGATDADAGYVLIQEPGAALAFEEIADHPTGPVIAGQGTVWVRDDAPNVLVFTDDTGADSVISGRNLANTLAAGNTTGGTNIVMTSGDIITTTDADPGIALEIKSGASTGTGRGGNLSLIAGDGDGVGGTGKGGNISLSSGGGGTAGEGGDIFIRAFGAGGNNERGGNISLNSGSGNGTGIAGSIRLLCSSSSGLNQGGDLTLNSGSGGSGGGANAGTVFMNGGAGTSGQDGGSINIIGGSISNGSGDTGSITIASGDQTSTATGPVGDITLETGTSLGTADGSINLNLQTGGSATGVIDFQLDGSAFISFDPSTTADVATMIIPDGYLDIDLLTTGASPTPAVRFLEDGVEFFAIDPSSSVAFEFSQTAGDFSLRYASDNTGAASGITITSQGSTTSTGGDIDIIAGDAGGSAEGGDIRINSGFGGGDITLTTGDAQVTDSPGGIFQVNTGDGLGKDGGEGGDITLNAGNGGNDGSDGAPGGNINLLAGNTTGDGTQGGQVLLIGGNGSGDSPGGPVEIRGGLGTGSPGIGGTARVRGGFAGGEVIILGGDSSVSGSNDGGDVFITAGGFTGVSPTANNTGDTIISSGNHAATDTATGDIGDVTIQTGAFTVAGGGTSTDGSINLNLQTGGVNTGVIDLQLDGTSFMEFDPSASVDITFGVAAGAVTLQYPLTSAAGSDININGQQSDTLGGGDIDFRAGAGGTTGGTADLRGGFGPTGGGDVTIVTGGSSGGDAGTLSLIGSFSFGGDGGDVDITGGAATAIGVGDGGDITINAGLSSFFNGGNISINAGSGPLGDSGTFLCGLPLFSDNARFEWFADSNVQLILGSYSTPPTNGSTIGMYVQEAPNTDFTFGYEDVVPAGGPGSTLTLLGQTTPIGPGGDVNIIAGQGTTVGGNILIRPGDGYGAGIDGYVDIVGDTTITGDTIITGDGYVSGDFSIAGKLTVDGLIDPTGLVLVQQSFVPGGIPVAGESTIWVRDTDGYLIVTDEFGTDTPISGGGSGGGGSGSQDLLTTLSLGNTTDGYNIDLTSGSALISSDGNVTIADTLDVLGDGYVFGNFDITGKLTVGGLIDPTGMVFTGQTVTPFVPAVGDATLWFDSTTDTFMFTNSVGTDAELGASGSSDFDGYLIDDGYSSFDDTTGTIDIFGPMMPDEVMHVDLKVFAEDPIDGYAASWNITGAFKADVFSGMVEQVGVAKIVTEFRDDATWSVDMTTDGMGIQLEMTGDEFDPVGWRAVGIVQTLFGPAVLPSSGGSGSSGAGGLTLVAQVTISTTVIVGQRQLIDPSDGYMVITAPSSPSFGDEFAINNNTTDTTTFTIAGGGPDIYDPITETVMASFTISGSYLDLHYQYDGAQWILI